MMRHAHQPSIVKSGFKRNGKPSASDSTRPAAKGIRRLTGLLARGGEHLTRMSKWMRTRVTWSKPAKARGERAIKILEAGGQIRRVHSHHHVVQSQSKPALAYDVHQRKGCRWSCTCKDHMHRKAQCKHILAVQAFVIEKEKTALDAHDKKTTSKQAAYSTIATADTVQKQTVQQTVQDTTHDDCCKDAVGGQSENIVIEPIEVPGHCVFCGHIEVIKWGKVKREPTADGEEQWSQRYRCKNGECKKTFVFRGGFERMRKPEWAILRALNDFAKGHSTRSVADTLYNAGVSVHPTTVYRWIAKFGMMLAIHMLSQMILTGERFCADEMWINIRGIRKYLFTMIDVSTRFCLAYELADRKDGHNAVALLRAAMNRAGKIPAEFISDSLPSYLLAFQETYQAGSVLEKFSIHISDACPGDEKRNNNIEERVPVQIRVLA